MKCRYFLLVFILMLSSFAIYAQHGMTSDAWMRMITANAVGKKGSVFAKPQAGYALYFSRVGDIDVPYLVYVPKGYDPAKPAPVVVFLHGAILARDSFHHKDPAIADEPVFSITESLNTIVVFPFSKNGFAWSAQTAACENVMSMIKQVQAHYNVDAKRVYIGGISMGGIATFWFIDHHPEVFAGFYTFSAMPALSEGIKFDHITTAKPLYSMNAKDDPVFSYSEVHAIYEQHKSEAPGWIFKSVDAGGHRFIYAKGGEKYVQELVGRLLAK